MKVKSTVLRQTILNATTDMIVKGGIGAVSTVKVARLSATTQSNIYSYFPNKQALLLAVFAYHQQQMIGALSPSISDTLTPKAQVTAFVKGTAEFGLAHPETIQVIASFRSQPDLRTKLPTIAESKFFSNLFKQLATYQAKGIIRHMDLAFLADSVFLIISNFVLTTQLDQNSPAPVSIDELIDLIGHLLFRSNSELGTRG